LDICENKATIDYHHSSALKLRKMCHTTVNTTFVSGSSPVRFPNYDRNLNKGGEGSKKGRTKSIHTEVVYFQRYHCLPVSVFTSAS